MGIYSNNDEIIAAGISYLRIIGFAYILFGLSNTMICCIRSIELVKISVVVNITSFCTNVFLNWVPFIKKSENSLAGMVPGDLHRTILPQSR